MCFFPTAASPCLSSPCSNGGTCEEIDNGYRCQCPEGFEGVHCDDESQDTGLGETQKIEHLIFPLKGLFFVFSTPPEMTV